MRFGSYVSETVVDVLRRAGGFHVECDGAELFRMPHERVDQPPLATTDADTVVRADHEDRRLRLRFLQLPRPLCGALVVVDPDGRRRPVHAVFDADVAPDRLPFAGAALRIRNRVVPGDDFHQLGVPTEQRIELPLAVRLPGGQPVEFRKAVRRESVHGVGQFARPVDAPGAFGRMRHFVAVRVECVRRTVQFRIRAVGLRPRRHLVHAAAA